MKFPLLVLAGLLSLSAVGFANTFESENGWRMERILHSPFMFEIRVFEQGDPDGYWFQTALPFVNQRGDFKAKLRKGDKELQDISGSLISSEAGMSIQIKSPPEEGDPSGLYAYVQPPEESVRLAVARQKERFVHYDARLNQVYQVLYKDLEPDRQQALIAMQQAWLGLRDHLASSPQVSNEEDPAFNPLYWEIMADMTLERIEWLRHFKGEHVDSSVTGSYLDGMGGILSIRALDDGEWEFAMHCVRGTSFHLGFLKGTAKTIEGGAKWVDTDQDAFNDGHPGQVSFLRRDNWVRVATENTQYYQGARAYFDGTYLKVTNDVEEFSDLE